MRRILKSGGVVQLALEKGKLNIAGEHHDKAPARRAQEAGFAKHKLGADAKYWTETELTVTKTEWLFLSKIVPADPPDLRFRHTLIYFKEAWEAYSATGANDARTQAKEVMSVRNDRMAEEIGRPGIQAPAHKADILSIARDLKILIKRLDPPDMAETARRLQQPEGQTAAEINKRVAKLEQYASINPQGKTTAALGAETMMARSQAMYAAAKAGAAQNGLWMVGEAHRVQIAAMPAAAFALTAENEFGQQVDAWLESQRKAADEPDQKEPMGMAARAYLAAAGIALPASAAAHSAATTAAPTVATAGTPAATTATIVPAVAQSAGPPIAWTNVKGPPPAQEMT